MKPVESLSPQVLALLLNDAEALTTALRTMEMSREVTISHYQKAIANNAQPKPDLTKLFEPWMKKESGCDREERELVLTVVKEIEAKSNQTRQGLMEALTTWNTENGHDPSSPYEVYEIPGDPVNSFIHYYAGIRYPLGSLVEELTIEEAQAKLTEHIRVLWLIQKELALIDSINPSLFYMDDHNPPSEERVQAYDQICAVIRNSHSKEDLQAKIEELEAQEQTPLRKTVVSYLKDTYLVSDVNQSQRDDSDYESDDDSDTNEDESDDDTYTELNKCTESDLE